MGQPAILQKDASELLRPVPLQDVASFNACMRAGLNDKLFFLDKIGHVDCFVDFGCGDASILRSVGLQRPGARLLGIDNDPAQRAAAGSPLVPVLERYPSGLRLEGTSCLILSSVMHEVYSHGIDHDFRAMMNLPWSYICIRDFALSEKGRDWSDVELMMKSQWPDDPREADETYFHHSAESWLAKGVQAYEDGYSVAHFDHHSHPPTRAYIEQTFGIDFPDRTHFTMILDRRD